MAKEKAPRTETDKARVVRKNLTKNHRVGLYEVSRFLDGDTRDRVGMRIPCKAYVQDPAVAKEHKELGLDDFSVRWEPGLGAGPTSARLAVVDYDADTGELGEPAAWDQDGFNFRGSGEKAIKNDPRSSTFRQIATWVQVERVLEYFEQARALGRPIPWGFEGNRLLLVPHAGYQDNAFYDRRSKSLQFYYFGDPKAPRYTCLSHDIVAHEAGHAVLDGIRPCFLENSSWETAAFHEFVGDLAAILLTLRHNKLRRYLGKSVGADLGEANVVFSLAEEFGEQVKDRPFLRSAKNSDRYEDAAALRKPHDASQVLTGAMFEILTGLAVQYLDPDRQARRKRKATAANALWWAIDGAAGIALQPLDLLPPADVRFADYARAVLCNHEIADPKDEHGYRPLMSRVFHQRGLCPRAYEECQDDPDHCALAAGRPPTFDVYHSLDDVARSRTAAYNFLHDNRHRLGIPDEQDFSVIDLYDASKTRSDNKRLPRQVVIQYLWREDVSLDGPEFGSLRGRSVELACGGTLVFDDRGNLLSWAFKRGRGTDEGKRRYADLREHVADQLAFKRIGFQDDSETAVPGVATPPVIARDLGGALRLETAPRGCALNEDDEEGPWTTSFF